MTAEKARQALIKIFSNIQLQRDLDVNNIYSSCVRIAKDFPGPAEKNASRIDYQFTPGYWWNLSADFLPAGQVFVDARCLR